MNTATFDLAWEETSWEEKPLLSLLVRQIARPRPQLRCPACRSILYSRRHKLCSVCGHELPEEVLFSPHEAARVKAMLDTEKRKHRDWMAKAL